VKFLSTGKPQGLLKLLIFGIVSLFVGLGLAITPANADSVGEEFPDAVTGNVRIEGEPVQGVGISLEGEGYSAATVTDERGRYFIGVPVRGVYQVTIDESTLPSTEVGVEGGATQEVEFQGFPGFLWQFALISANLFHGVDLSETDVKDSIEMAGSRPMLILHGDIDQRLDYQSSVDFYEYAKSVGAEIKLETFENADHTEGMLTETDRYAKVLSDFFNQNLVD